MSGLRVLKVKWYRINRSIFKEDGKVNDSLEIICKIFL